MDGPTADESAATLVVLGDSVAQGQDDPAPGGGWLGWSGRLASLLGVPPERLVNTSDPGATVRDVARHQLPVVQRMRPEFVALGCGMNDALKGFQVDDAMGDLESVFQWAHGTGSTTVVVPVPEPPLLTKQRMREPRRQEIHRYIDIFNLALHQLAGKYQALCPRQGRDCNVNDPDLWSADGIHLNAAGHGFVADVLATMVRARRDEAALSTEQVRGRTSC